MSDSRLKRLLVHISHYSVASLLTTIAGFISFPLLTRVFSVADFGLMGLIGVTMTISVAFGKLGAQHAMLRFYSEVSAGKRPFTLQQLAGTALVGMTVTGVTVAGLLLAATQLAPVSLLSEPRLRRLLAIACIPVVARVIESSLVNFVRAAQQTKLLATYDVAKRYLGLGLILFALFVVAGGLTGFYVAMAVTETLAVLALGVAAFRGSLRPSVRDFSGPLFKQMLGYGLPMMIGFEISGIILAVGDRYAVNWLAGPAQLGLYSAAYTLCEYVQTVVIGPVGQALVPMYLQMWDTRGREETTALIARSLRTYVMLGVPIIVGIAAVGPELLPGIASEKFAGAAAVLPWVIAGMVVDGSSAMTGAGLVIHRRTRRIMAIVMLSAAVNIALNIVLVPRVGIVGAAIATLVSYAICALLFALGGSRILTVVIPWGTILRAGAAAGVMYLGVAYLMPGQRLITVLVRATAGAILYGALLVLIDPDARSLARGVLARLGWVRALEPPSQA